MAIDASQFEVKGCRDGSSAITRLVITASSIEEARSRASAQGYHVIGIGRTGASMRWLGTKGRSALTASHLSAELLGLLRAGLSLPEAMSALQTRRRTLAAGQSIDRICQALREGRSFSAAL